MRRFLRAALICASLGSVLLTAIPQPAVAQEVIEEYAESEPSADQVRLNKAAVEAIVAEDYVRAATLLEASLELGENNVTWLNLGRAYQKSGRCKDAKRAYLSAVSAPAVDEPSPALVNAKAEQYLEELEEGCDEVAQSEETGEEGGGADGDSTWAQDDASATDDGSATGDAPADDAVEPPPSDTGGGSNVLGWATTIGGVSLLGTSAVFYLLARQEHQVVTDALESKDSSDGTVHQISRREAFEHQERGDMYDTIALSGAIAGAAVTGLGIYLLVSDTEESNVSLGTDGESWALSFSTRF